MVWLNIEGDNGKEENPDEGITGTKKHSAHHFAKCF
jgi:hypothetical protein